MLQLGKHLHLIQGHLFFFARQITHFDLFQHNQESILHIPVQNRSAKGTLNKEMCLEYYNFEL